MGKKKAAVTARAWRLLRLALLWARKGGAFRRSLFSGGKFLKGLRWGGGDRINDGYQIRQGDKELSFCDTPVLRLGGKSDRWRSGSMRLIIKSIPCMNPPSPACSLGFEGDEEYGESSREALFRRSYSEIEDENGEEEFSSVEWMEAAQEVSMVEEEQQGQDEVDDRAEEFIARFYRQMKLQRQVSLLEYHEMLNRGT